MWEGHLLALTGWLEADQAELTLLHRPEAEGALTAPPTGFARRGGAWSPRAPSRSCPSESPLGLEDGRCV